MDDDKYVPYKAIAGWSIKPFSSTSVYIVTEGSVRCRFRASTTESASNTVLSFVPSHRNLKEFLGKWLIKGYACFKEGINTLLQVSFTCSQANAEHTFESTSLDGKDVSVHFQFTELVGMGVVPRPNYNLPTNLTDVCLVVEGQRLHLSKTILAHYSDYFAAMFSGTFSESTKKEIEIKVVNRSYFIALLDLCFGSHLITLPHVEKLLEYADRFSIPSVLTKIETMLVDTVVSPDTLDNIQLLSLADRYKLTLLMSHAVSSFTHDEYKKLMASSAVHSLSQECVVALLKRGESLFGK